jgi:hypothetical protein
MATGMHYALHRGGEFAPRALLDRERVHIGAQENGAPRPLALEVGDDARRRDPRAHLEPEALEARGHDVGGAHLMEAELGVAMDVAPHGHEIAIEELYVPANIVGHIHLREAVMLTLAPPPSNEAVTQHSYFADRD